ncbi:MAG: T9SS type A sorting domain-containing protein [Flavobacterium sp.]|nr:MAG: T9SS type A sorting domain-containing protein [Flavobacterium sp.]
MNKNYLLFIAFLIVNLSFGQIINFPDANFKAKLLQPNVGLDELYQAIQIDANSDGEIQAIEAQQVYYLNVSNAGISNLTGISSFTNMLSLACDYNSLTSLQIDPSIVLEGVSASHNLLTSFNAAFDVLYGATLDLSYNSFTTLIVPAGHFEDNCNLSHNQLTTLTFSGNTVWYLDLSYNNLSQIGGNCDVFKTLDVTHNNFSMLDLSNFTFGYESTLFMGYNPSDVVAGNHTGNISYSSDKTFADFGDFSAYGSCDPEMTGNLTLSNCPNLQRFSLKNGFNHTFYTCNEGGDIFNNNALSLSIQNCPSLNFICVDEAEKPYIEASVAANGLQFQVEVNSYCTFTPGGPNYFVNGTTQFDANANGCDASDIHVPHINVAVSNGTSTANLIGNASGNYSIGMTAGTYTITPANPNPAIFSVYPTSQTVSFPANASPYNQNFCLTAVGVHPDLEISLLSNWATPGFDGYYTIVYKNKGNQVQSGTINLAFNDAVLDFVSASPNITTQTTNALTWDFSDLQPFEDRQIHFVLNLNSPVENPPVNSGDVLPFTASITNTQTDETPANNVAVVNQTVHNSFDPNDKICLEGDVVSPEMIGQYIHYIIHFENSGTANAKNIVVADLIDATKFDVSSLEPIDGSAPFITRIVGNKAEFIFENINLPFDDANNDGYVSFKIKTNPTLAVGDTFSNGASIYFDYNFPIVTNTATTTIQQLGNPDFDFSDEFVLYPNPVANALNIKSKNGVEVKSVSIYNDLGQLLQVETGNPLNIDSSKLATGQYFIKVYSASGTAVAKFMKQ